MTEPGSELRFDRAQFEAAPATACAFCARPLAGSYYEINGKLACESCRYQAEEVWNGGSGVARFLKASAYGVVAAILGAAIWYGVRNIGEGQHEYSIVAIGVGFLVGGAVRAGSGRRGGWRYQALAIVLTYSSIVSTYVPFVMSSLRGDVHVDTAPTSSGILIVVISVLLAYVWPFLVLYADGLNGVLGIVIIGIGLWQAWKINVKMTLQIAGPFSLARPQPPASSSESA